MKAWNSEYDSGRTTENCWAIYFQCQTTPIQKILLSSNVSPCNIYFKENEHKESTVLKSYHNLQFHFFTQKTSMKTPRGQ